MMKLWLLAGILSCSLIASAQRSIAVIGSSTAWGKGATAGHAWVDLTRAYLKSQGLIDTVYNIAYSGLTTWAGLPTGTPTPPSPDTIIPKRNVTKALSYLPLPKMVIVSYPTNDIYEGYSVTQFLANLRLIYNTVVAAHSICFITTTQPRNNMNPTLRKMLLDATDSILKEYPDNSLNFYDTLTDRYSRPDSLSIKTQYSFGDGIHVNDSGHMALFQMVKNSATFMAALNLQVSGFGADSVKGPSALIHWTAAHADTPVIFFVQRGADSLHLADISRQTGTTSIEPLDYSYADSQVLTGISYYRLRTTENGLEQFSPIVSFSNIPPVVIIPPVDTVPPVVPEKGFSLQKVYSPAGSASLVVQISSAKDQTLHMAVYNISGSLLRSQEITIIAPGNTVTIGLPGLVAGEYFVKVSDGGGQKQSRAFMKL